MWLSPGLAHDVRAAAAESAHEKVLEKGFTHETPTPPLLQDGYSPPPPPTPAAGLSGKSRRRRPKARVLQQGGVGER